MEHRDEHHPKVIEPVTETPFDREPLWDGQRFLLLGTGVRKLRLINVYAIGFAMEAEHAQRVVQRYFQTDGKRHAHLRGKALALALENDPQFWPQLLALPADKGVELVYRHGVAVERMRALFRQALVNQLGELKLDDIERVLAPLDRDLVKGDRMVIRTRGDAELLVHFDGEVYTYPDAPIARAALIPYLVPESITPSLLPSVAEGIALLAERPQ